MKYIKNLYKKYILKEEEYPIKNFGVHKVIIFTGAGISKDSGIPTFQDTPEIRGKLNIIYKNSKPEEYEQMINELFDKCDKAEPNDAHKSIAEYDIPIITMNIDKLHEKAGSNNVLHIHGDSKENIVLYGDIPTLYDTAVDLLYDIKYDDSYFIIIGTSFFLGICKNLKTVAERRNAKIIIINDNASKKVPKLMKKLYKKGYIKKR